MSVTADTPQGSPAERIKRCAFNAERLVAVLSTLADRIDQARANGNQELLDHYTKEFQKASLKFMGNVEALLDDYYLIKGKRRSRIANEPLEPAELEEIYSSVKAMIDLLPPEPRPEDSLEPPRRTSPPKGRLDVKG
ncbi:hypothetical protein TheveDRAFT_1677 [Thermanaerovibrio velox DSM 12556]|uniref:Uncharacterized protein n=1 Tax=Thermanaerovibrio velox DSM 12556 TaxID=926567 RepID=H0UQN1_9BACT|nr:hypothetical protein [Thermanaerovibrio velox]EHM10795.1 hypothetical protein TheveDRAFT_1677 [Thermanaerovibrio velox DSM 12556]